MNFDVFRAEHLELEEAAPAVPVYHLKVVDLRGEDRGRAFADRVDHGGTADENGGVDADTLGDQVANGVRFQQRLVQHELAGGRRDDPAGFLGAVCLERGETAAAVQENIVDGDIVASREAALGGYGDVADGAGLTNGVDVVYGGSRALTGNGCSAQRGLLDHSAVVAQVQAIGADEAHAAPGTHFGGELAIGASVVLDFQPGRASRDTDVMDDARGGDADDGRLIAVLHSRHTRDFVLFQMGAGQFSEVGIEFVARLRWRRDWHGCRQRRPCPGGTGRRCAPGCPAYPVGSGRVFHVPGPSCLPC